MNRKSVLLLCTLTISFYSSAIDKTATTFYAGRFGGMVAGATAGAVAGAATGFGLTKTIKPQGVTTKRGVALGVGALAAAGAWAGRWAGEKAAINYMSKRYNVAPQVVEAAITFNKDLAIDKNRRILYDAHQKNTKELNDYLSTAAHHLFGSQGAIQELIIQALQHISTSQHAWVPADITEFKARKNFKAAIGATIMNKFDHFINNALPLALLYFNKPIPTPRHSLYL